jgi:hypothetical protein
MSAPPRPQARLAAITALLTLCAACAPRDDAAVPAPGASPDTRAQTGGQQTGEQSIVNSAARTDRVRMSGGDRGFEHAAADPSNATGAEGDFAAQIPPGEVGALGGVQDGNAARAASRRGGESLGTGETSGPDEPAKNL